MLSSSADIAAALIDRLDDGVWILHPADATVLEANDAAREQVGMASTAPGADGNERTAAAYVVKYSTHPGAIVDYAYFENTATLFGQTLSPQAAGQLETLVLTGLQADTSYYIAVVARDEDKNQGDLSNSTFSWAQSYVLGVEIANLDGDPDLYGFGSLSMSSAVI